MGQGVVWYTGQFYAMSFMKTVMNIDSSQVDSLLGIALLIGTPFFIVFGWLSDKIGRKYIMMGGMLLAGVLAFHLLPDEVTFSDTVQIAGEMGKLNLVNLEFDITDRYNIWSGLIAGTFLFLSYFGL